MIILSRVSPVLFVVRHTKHGGKRKKGNGKGKKGGKYEENSAPLAWLLYDVLREFGTRHDLSTEKEERGDLQKKGKKEEGKKGDCLTCFGALSRHQFWPFLGVRKNKGEGGEFTEKKREGGGRGGRAAHFLFRADCRRGSPPRCGPRKKKGEALEKKKGRRGEMGDRSISRQDLFSAFVQKKGKRKVGERKGGGFFDFWPNWKKKNWGGEKKGQSGRSALRALRQAAPIGTGGKKGQGRREGEEGRLHHNLRRNNTSWEEGEKGRKPKRTGSCLIAFSAAPIFSPLLLGWRGGKGGGEK